jgi:hypothetical protein
MLAGDADRFADPLTPMKDAVGAYRCPQWRYQGLAHGRWHPIVVEAHPLVRVFECGPNDVLQTGVLRRISHRCSLRQFSLG